MAGVELGTIGNRIRRDQRATIFNARPLFVPVLSSGSTNSIRLAQSLAHQQDSIESLQRQIARLERELVDLHLIQFTAADGKPVAWAGINPPYQGGAFETLYVGANALVDPANANIVASDSGVAFTDCTFTLSLNGITTTIDNSLLGGSYTGLKVNEDATGDKAIIFHGVFAAIPAGGADNIVGLALYTSAIDLAGKFFLRDGTESGGQDGLGRQVWMDGANGYAHFSGGLGDAAGNELLRHTTTASAVNDLTLANAATGNNPTLSASGDDANVGIDLTPKGTGTINITGEDNLTEAGIINQKYFFVYFHIPGGAAAADYDGVQIVPDASEVVSVTERHASIATSGPTTLMVKKVPSGTALASGTDTLSAGIDLTATADTNQSGSLHGTQANYQLAAGDSLGLVTTGTLTGVDSVAVTVKLKRI